MTLKILHVTPSYFPATYYGGPIFSTYGISNELAAMPGVELRVLSSDMAGPKLSDRVPFDVYPKRYPAGYEVYFEHRIMMPDIAPGMVARLWSLSAKADVIWLTGTYSFPTLPTLIVCRMLKKPLVWSPRGALLASYQWQGARRPSAKRAFERICQTIRPPQAVFHVTSEIEKQASLERMPGFDAVIIANGVELPEALPARHWQPNGILRLMFISRLDPKKGLENLLHAMPLLSESTTLDIYGAGEPAYVRTLKALADTNGVGKRVSFHGHVDGAEKRAAFSSADLFVLPTHSENFGMVVAEALAHGIPTVVSHGAPWFDLNVRGCGLWVSSRPESLVRAIESLRGADLADMGNRGRQWMRDEFSWSSRAEELKGVFIKLREQKDRQW